MRKASARLELRVPPQRRARYETAAERRGLTLSDWVRRRLDEAADVELAAEVEPPPPADEDVATALAALEELASRNGDRLRARIRAAKEEPWS